MNTRSTQAISPIFATLIILAVVTILFIPVFMWSTGISGQTQDSWQLSGLTVTERIVVEEVNLRVNQPNCTIYVRNIGKTSVTVDNVFISITNGTYYPPYDKSSFTTAPNSAVQGDLITVTISVLGFNVVPEKTYNVQVFTTRGVSDEYQVVT